MNNHGKSSKALGSSANNGKSLGIVKRGPVLEKSRGSKITRVAGQRETVLNILTEVKPESEGRNELVSAVPSGIRGITFSLIVWYPPSTIGVMKVTVVST